MSEVVSIRTSEVDFDRGLIKIWDEKKDEWRFIMPTLETIEPRFGNISILSIATINIFSLLPQIRWNELFGSTLQASLGFVISWHALRTTYVSRSVEWEQSLAVVMLNTGDSPATILKSYTKLQKWSCGGFVKISS